MGAGKAIIIGAGTAGLAAHLALREAGFDVLHIERKRTVEERGGNLAIWPNGGRVLQHFGLGDGLARVGFAPAGFTTFDADGDQVTHVDFRPIAQRMGMPMYYTPRAHFQGLLFDAVGRTNVELGVAGGAIEHDDGSVRVALDDGRVAEADVLIAADGVRSAVRRHVVGEVALGHVGVTIWTGWIPDAGLINEISPAPDKMVEFWGPGQRLIVVPSGHDHIGFTFVMRVAEDFDTPDPHRWLRDRFAGYPPAAQTMLDRITNTDIVKWSVYDVPPLPNWAKGPVLLIGDGAHAASPTLGQGAGMALEDAFVLGQCLSDTDTPIPERLLEFQRRRRPRAEHLAFESRSRSVASTETDPERFAKLQAAVRAGDPHTVLNGMLEMVSGGPIA